MPLCTWASTCLHHRQLRRVPGQAGHHFGQAVGGLREGTLTASLTALRTPFGQQRQRTVDRVGVATDHDLARRIEVGRHHHLAACRFGADVQHQLVFSAEHGGHGADTGRCGFLHQLAAQAHQVRTVMQAQCACGNQGGVLAQAVAGHHRRRGPPTAFQARHTPMLASRAGWVSVRLSISSGPPWDSAHRSTPAPSDASVGFTHLWVQFGQLGHHAHRLRALAGEDKSEGGYGHAVIRLLQSKRAMIRGTCRVVRTCAYARVW